MVSVELFAVVSAVYKTYFMVSIYHNPIPISTRQGPASRVREVSSLQSTALWLYNHIPGTLADPAAINHDRGNKKQNLGDLKE